MEGWKLYVVFRCLRCGRYLYAKMGVKSRTCVCGFKNDMRKVRIVARAEDERVAGEIVRRLQGSGTDFKSLAPE